MKVILFQLLIFPIFSYIIFPLKKDNLTISSVNENKPEEIFSKLLKSNLYIILNIGSKKVDIKASLADSKTELIISGKKIKNHKYDETQSLTYNITNNTKVTFQYNTYKEGILSTEKFNILNSSKELNPFIIDFILGTDISTSYIYRIEAETGLYLPSSKSFNDCNLIISLKNSNAISSYNWFLDFNNFEKGEGKMIIDTFPHSLYKDKYKEENFVKTNAVNKYGTLTWGFKFSNINYGDEILPLSEDLKAFIGFENGIISAPDQIGVILESRFFSQYIDKNICFKENIGYVNNYFFYCKKDGIFSIENFQSIYFNCNDLEIIFELDYQDLFYTEGDNIYFLIEFKKNVGAHWTFGKAFLKKYFIVFNQKDKTLGYYKYMEKNKNDKNNNDKNNSFFYNFILIIIISVLLVIAMIILGIYLYKKKKYKKQKANELDEDYDYEQKLYSEKSKSIISDNANIINTF